MKTRPNNSDALTWSRIREISREANSLSTHLADMGHCTKTQLAHVDSALLTPRVHGETVHQAPAGENPFPSCAK